MNPDVARVITNLLRGREYLGYQLGHAQGTIDDAGMEEIHAEYLGAKTSDPEHVRAAIRVLHEYGIPIDADIVAAAAECTIEAVDAALLAAL